MASPSQYNKLQPHSWWSNSIVLTDPDSTALRDLTEYGIVKITLTSSNTTEVKLAVLPLTILELSGSSSWLDEFPLQVYLKVSSSTPTKYVGGLYTWSSGTYLILPTYSGTPKAFEL